MIKYEIVMGFLHEAEDGAKIGKKIIVQVGNYLFELHNWGEVKDAADLAKLLKDDRYALKLLKEE